MGWDERHALSSLTPPDSWVASLGPLLSSCLPSGVLDVACGLGRNTLWAAEVRGSDRVLGVDASPIAIDRAREFARSRKSAARFELWDVSSQGLPAGPWGAILLLHFLDRTLYSALADSLAPGGLLAWKTHLRHPLRPSSARPRRAEFLLESGELPAAFPSLHVQYYREWADRGEAFAALVARRPGHSR